MSLSRSAREPQADHPAAVSSAALSVSLEAVSKAFDGRRAVEDLSFSVERGEVFGLVGPNGAGKTTTIRMLLDIIRPDEGTIRVLGHPMHEGLKSRIGYLPEERGLYRNLRVLETLRYLGALKGMTGRKARSRAADLLERVGLYEDRQKKVSELSRGMTQLVQVIATILHEPELLILDEPFSGLDPVNVRLLKSMLVELQARGVTVIFSTHQMNQVEELCDRVLMVHHGRSMLYGPVQAIKRQYRSSTVILSAPAYPDVLPGVASWQDYGTYRELTLSEDAAPQDLLTSLVERGVEIERFEVALPSLEEIFVRVAGEEVA